MENKKTAFLILRISEALKKRIIQRAKRDGKSISEFVRGLLDVVVK